MDKCIHIGQHPMSAGHGKPKKCSPDAAIGTDLVQPYHRYINITAQYSYKTDSPNTPTNIPINMFRIFSNTAANWFNSFTMLFCSFICSSYPPAWCSASGFCPGVTLIPFIFLQCPAPMVPSVLNTSRAQGQWFHEWHLHQYQSFLLPVFLDI